MLGVRDGYQNDTACTAMRAVRCRIVDGGAQWMVLTLLRSTIQRLRHAWEVRTEVYCVSLSQNTASS